MDRTPPILLLVALVSCAAPAPPAPTHDGNASASLRRDPKEGVLPAPAVSSPPPVAVVPAPALIPPDAAAAPAPTPVAVDTSRGECPEAQHLARFDPTTDPAVSREVRAGTFVDVSLRTDEMAERTGRLIDGTRSYSLEGDSSRALVAREGTNVVWRADGFPIAGGFFSVWVSHGGHVVERRYSRGHSELFDARTGARYAEVGRDIVVDPQDRYALDPPEMNWHEDAGHFNRVEVHKLSFAHAPAVARTVARMPTDPRKDWSSVDAAHTPTFGAAICATGDLYVLSHPDSELALYRASDDVKLASVPHPPSGRPFFTRSGRFVGIHGPPGTDREGQIVGAYRLVP